MKRQSDVYEGTYKEDLTSIQSNQRSRVVHERPRYIRAVSHDVTCGAEGLTGLFPSHSPLS